MRNRIEEYENTNNNHVASTAETNKLPVSVHNVDATVSRIRGMVESTIRERPLAALTIGMIAGVTLGCLIKRR